MSHLVQQHRAKGTKFCFLQTIDTKILQRNFWVSNDLWFIFAGRTVALHQYFKLSKTSEVLLISKIGDTSIDLPECNVVMQISAHGGSRRQEAQRLVAFCDPKKAKKTLIMQSQMHFFTPHFNWDCGEKHNRKRKKYLNEQGYPYTVLDSSFVLDNKDAVASGIGKEIPLAEQRKLLVQLLKTDIDKEDEAEEVATSEDDDDLYSAGDYLGNDFTTTNGTRNSQKTTAASRSTSESRNVGSFG